MGEIYRGQLWDFTQLGQLGMAAIYARLQSVGRGDTPQVICLNSESSGVTRDKGKDNTETSSRSQQKCKIVRFSTVWLR